MLRKVIRNFGETFGAVLHSICNSIKYFSRFKQGYNEINIKPVLGPYNFQQHSVNIDDRLPWDRLWPHRLTVATKAVQNHLE